MYYWYDMTSDERKRCGVLGKKYVMNRDIGMSSKSMSTTFIKYMNDAFDNWKPKERYILESV